MIRYNGENPFYDMQSLYDDVVAMVSCDSTYLRDHARAWVGSCILSGNFKRCHIHVVSRDDADFALIGLLKMQARALATAYGKMFHGLTATFEEDCTGLTDNERRAWYANARFVAAYNLMTEAIYSVRTLHGGPSVLLTDVDCVFMNRFVEPQKRIGLFLREPLPNVGEFEREGTRVAAGMVYCHISERDFLGAVSNVLTNNALAWFMDQRALWEVARSRLEHVHPFTKSDMNWSFDDASATVWTGKGPLKHTSKPYLDAKKCFDDAMLNVDLWSHV